MTDPIERIKSLMKNKGLRELARDLDVSPSYLSDVLNEKKTAGPEMLEAIGLERHVTYKRKGNGK